MKRKEEKEKENRMIGNNIIISKNIKKEMVLNQKDRVRMENFKILKKTNTYIFVTTQARREKTFSRYDTILVNFIHFRDK